MQISGNNINATSEDITLNQDDTNKNINCTSGDISISNCKVNNINATSGDVTIYDSTVNDINVCSGDVTLDLSNISNINTTSGDISAEKCEINNIITVSGDIDLYKCNVQNIKCSAPCIESLDKSTIQKIYITSGGSSINIKSNGNICINNINKCNNVFNSFNKVFKGMFNCNANINVTINGKKVDIESEECNTIKLDKTSQVKEIEFEKFGHVYSSYDLIVKNGELHIE